MSYWTDMYMRYEQLIDRRQEAANYRLTNRTRLPTREHTTIFDQMMALAGRQFISWGQRLETYHN